MIVSGCAYANASNTVANWIDENGGQVSRAVSITATEIVNNVPTTVSIPEPDLAAWMAQGNTPAAYVAPTIPPTVAAKAALDEADITMLRISEAVSLGSNSWTNTDVVAWVNYRRSLRSIVDSNTGSLPSKPSYPAGT